jgi:hypothetical protein
MGIGWAVIDVVEIWLSWRTASGLRSLWEKGWRREPKSAGRSACATTVCNTRVEEGSG